MRIGYHVGILFVFWGADHTRWLRGGRRYADAAEKRVLGVWLVIIRLAIFLTLLLCYGMGFCNYGVGVGVGWRRDTQIQYVVTQA
jgi:hypothetical protein